MTVLPFHFYQSSDVVQIAKDLLGKWLFSQVDNSPITGGIIIETEAYAGAEDRACHAFGNRRTQRTEVMFHEGGIAYIYLCYGIHHLLNVVTNRKNVPHAVLIRALYPKLGIETMLKRRKKTSLDLTLTAGPGSICQALGLDRSHNGLSFDSKVLWIEDHGHVVHPKSIQSSPRIGVEYAKEHALLPWRFYISRDLFS
jgi:DNA-3-methyladenine glycosylase